MSRPSPAARPPAPGVLLAAASAALLAAASAAAQQSAPVSSVVEVSGAAASVSIEFADGRELEISFAGGTATIDGEPVGSYEPGGAADRAWRDLLSSGLSLSDGPLARELGRWRPDPGLPREDLALLQAVESALEGIGEPPQRQAAEPAQSPAAAAEPRDEPRRAETEIEVDVDIDIDRIRAEVRRELEREAAAAGARSAQRRTPSFWSRIARAADDIFDTLGVYIVLAGLTLLLTRIAGPRLDTVSREAAHRPWRAAVVGLSGAVLAPAVFAVGTLALAVTVIGLLLVPFWIIAQAAVPLAVLFGGIAVSCNVGRWVADQDDRLGLRLQGSRPARYRLVGLAVLLVPFAAAGALKALPWVGWAGGLLAFLASLALAAAAFVGLGAVIVTRGGKYATDWPRDPRDDGEIAADWSFADEADETRSAEDGAQDAP